MKNYNLPLLRLRGCFKCHITSICLLMSVICLLSYTPAHAAASITLSGGSWALGTKGGGVTTTQSGWTITGASDGTENIQIAVSSTGVWTPATTAGSSQYVLKASPTSGGEATQVVTGTAANLVTGLAVNGTHNLNLALTTPTGGEEGAHTLTVTLTAASWVWNNCGNTYTVTHTAGDTAPVTKTVTYGTVSSTLGGTGTKCWITQNLGADQQATSATDSTEASAGWYWQFNRKQGYKNDGTTLTPSSWTITSISEDSNWTSANDPCALLLGTGWRLPTYTEWTNADSTGGWTNYTGTYASVLKIHPAGYLNYSYGALYSRGSGGYDWSSTQYDATDGWVLAFDSGASGMYDFGKAYGFSVRCVKD